MRAANKAAIITTAATPDSHPDCRAPLIQIVALQETVAVEIKYRRIHVLPPIGKKKRYPALDLTVLHAQERGDPEHRPKIDWKLITDLPVRSHEDAIEKLDWYAMRWKIETVNGGAKPGHWAAQK